GLAVAAGLALMVQACIAAGAVRGVAGELRAAAASPPGRAPSRAAGWAGGGRGRRAGAGGAEPAGRRTLARGGLAAAARGGAPVRDGRAERAAAVRARLRGADRGRRHR